MPVKYVFVTGGVVSGLGKGITAAFSGASFKSERIPGNHARKFDPYIQYRPRNHEPDSSTVEVFVTDDGTETRPGSGTIMRVFID